MWVTKDAKRGDQIRVSRGLYYHHGIYASDDEIYQFASPIGSEISSETAEVCITTLKQFLNGGVLEVRTYTDSELKTKRTPDEIIEYAKSHLGEKGYNVITNNCEHFSNRCAFGESKSDQIDEFMSLLGGLFRG